MADQKITVAQLTELVQQLAETQAKKDAQIDELMSQLTAAKTARSKSGGSYVRKIRDGLEYTDLLDDGKGLTWIQALILDQLNDVTGALVIKVLAGRCHAVAKCDPTNGVGRIISGDSGLEAQFRAIMTGLEVKGLVARVRGGNLAHQITDHGAEVFAAIKRDIKTGGLKDMFLYPSRVTQFAWDYMNDKFGDSK